MKFNELPKRYKRTIMVLIGCLIATSLAWAGTYVTMSKQRANQASQRALVRKTDEELIGQRFMIERDQEAPVEVVLHQPKEKTETAIPILINLHGGGFVFGDASEMDSQAQYWADDWQVLVVSVNYTKLDTKPVSYGVEEVLTTIDFLTKNADIYKVDPSKLFVMGHSAGAYYAASSAIALQEKGIPLTGQILVSPWTSGLPDKLNNRLAPALFILGTDDEISLKSKAYQEHLATAGVPVTAISYEGGKHPFISTPYPELGAHWSQEEIDEFITPDQQDLARQAETDIKHWITQQLTK